MSNKVEATFHPDEAPTRVAKPGPLPDLWEVQDRRGNKLAGFPTEQAARRGAIKLYNETQRPVRVKPAAARSSK